MGTRSQINVAGACVAMMIALPVSAHHAMDSALPATLFQGMASGLAHPVIGPDHLLFIIALGAACYFFQRGAGTILSFIAATLGGTVIHLYQATLPFSDAWVAVSLVLLGALFLAGAKVLRSDAVLVLFALSGIVHGYAYGEAIVGAEPTPLLAYLVGFTLVQAAIASAGYALAHYAARAKPTFSGTRAVGTALSIAGVMFLALAFV